MKKIHLFIVIILLFSLIPFRFEAKAQLVLPELSSGLQSLLDNPLQSKEVEAIITYKEMPLLSDISLLEDLGFVTKTFDSLPMVAVKGKSSLLASLLSRIEAGNILSIYENSELQYYLRDSRALIGAESVWNDLGYTGKGVTVAVIDSGIDATHPDLKFGEKVVQNVKFAAGDFFGAGSLYLENVPNSDTSSGHGTHVAGTIAGSGAGSAGLYKGVAPDAKLVGLGVGEGINILWSLEAFDYAISNKEKYGIDVISNSWGSTGEYSPNHPINLASKRAHDAGMTVVFAAGNEGPNDNTLNPYSAAPWVISVAAGTKDRQLAEFSSRGVAGDEHLHPDITAPGVDIVAARSSTGVVMNTLGLATDATYIDAVHLPYYTTSSGTSMATPHISGVVALMKEAQPGLTPDMALDIMEQTADPMNGYQLHEAGAGYVNAYKAVEKAASAKIHIGKYKDKQTGKTYDTYTTEHTWKGSVAPGVADIGAASHDFHDIRAEKDDVSLKVRIDWILPVNDLDLEIRDPNGQLAGSSGNALTNYEETNIGSLLPGTYKVDVIGYLNSPVNYKGTYTVERILR
jgi:serine protease AprX